MNWTTVTEDVIAQVRTSRLRRDLRLGKVTLGGLSLEDFIQQTLLEVLAASPPATSTSPSVEEHEELVQKITQLAIQKIESHRRKLSYRESLLKRYLPTIPTDTSEIDDESLSKEILLSVQDDQEARMIVLAVLGDLCDFRDTQCLSEITELSITDVENAKKRVRRRLKTHFANYALSRERGA